MKKSPNDLDYYLIDTRNPKPDETYLCERAYNFWKAQWLDTYNALGVEAKNFHSDDFLDREMSALFYSGEPVALFFNNWFDISRNSILAHSYFKNHPKEVIKFLQDKDFRQVMFLSYMTVHPDWRSTKINFSMPDLLFSLSIKRFKELGMRALSGYIRTDKSFFSSFYRHGAEKITSSVAYNVSVDFCYVTDKTAKISDEPGIKESCEYLWHKMKENSKTLIKEAS